MKLDIVQSEKPIDMVNRAYKLACDLNAPVLIEYSGVELTVTPKGDPYNVLNYIRKIQCGK